MTWGTQKPIELLEQIGLVMTGVEKQSSCFLHDLCYKLTSGSVPKRVHDRDLNIMKRVFDYFKRGYM